MSLNNLWVRVGIAFIALGLAVFYLMPTYQLYSLKAKDTLTPADSLKIEELSEKAINLGLDLQGGMHLVVEIDKSELSGEDEIEEARDRALQVIRNRIDEFGVREPIIQKQGDERIIVQLAGVTDPDRAKAIVNRTAFLEFKLVEKPDELNELLQKIDETLASSSSDTAGFNTDQNPFTKLLSSSGSDLLIPDENLDEVRRILGDPVLYRRADPQDKPKYAGDPRVKRLIKKQNEIAYGKREQYPDGQYYTPLFLLKSKAELTGEHLKDARVELGQGYDPKTAGKPYVSLTFTSEGADLFADVTGANIKERLAIVLDGRVQSAPVIQDKIRGGRAQITGDFSMEEAKDLRVVLKAGSLPVPIRIEEERTVGATLGADSIRSGQLATIVGLAAVAVFIVIWYKLSGFVALLALVLNVVFIMAALAGFGATLTLPGIAGIILTIGMAVDANVLIFERIREELRTGKSVRAAIDAGYGRAFRTILDANVTTLITAIVLYQFGTGPIKGFAVTLSIGIVMSMFTAIFVTRIVFDAILANRPLQKLSI
ncbi:MAG: protein translocase subunit SecD [Gemmatimonadetes bacterium]|nr:MAG: protein translocase subunit SecD [Gemmatimonadota bacterium]